MFFLFQRTYMLLEDIYHIVLDLCYRYFYCYVDASICTELSIPWLKSDSDGHSVVALWKLEWWCSLNDVQIPIASSVMQNARKGLSLRWLQPDRSPFSCREIGPNQWNCTQVLTNGQSGFKKLIFLLTEGVTSKIKSRVCSARPQAEECSALLLLLWFSKCVF